MSQALIERYWVAQDPFDPAALGAMRHATWSADWPQSGERVPSHEADIAIHTAYQGYPAHHLERLGGSDEIWRTLPALFVSSPVRISGASDIWIGEVRLQYPDGGVWYSILVLELREGLIGRETAWFARASDPPPWAAISQAPAPVPLPTISVSMEHDADVETRHRATHAAAVALAPNDPTSAVRTLFSDGAVIDRPQYGRRVSGRAGIVESHQERADLPPVRIRRVLSSGDILLVESRLDTPTGDWWSASILEFQGDQVVRETEYLAESYAPPEARSAWIEPLEPTYLD